jgi:hypothetical protein
MLDAPMPWFVTLIGRRPIGSAFTRLVSQLGLSRDKHGGVTERWYENDEGVLVSVREGRVSSIQFFSSESPDFTGFSAQLPLALRFEMARDDVRALLGTPDHVTPAREHGVTPRAGIDRFDAASCTVAVSYSLTSGRIVVLGFERAGRRG